MEKGITKTIVIMLSSAAILTACQSSPSREPERPLNTGDRPRLNETEEPREEILPMLELSLDGESKEFKLRSQTSKYLNSSESELEITVTSSRLAYCQNEKPALEEGDYEVTFQIKNTSGEALAVGDLLEQSNYEVSGKYRSNSKELDLSKEDFSKFQLSDLNQAIARGQFAVEKEGVSVSGEFFTAICK